MKPSCYSLEELVVAAEQPRGEPRREHLETCPRCRAALTAYRDFMDERDRLPAEARAAECSGRLQEILEAQILGEPVTRSAPDARRAGGLRAGDGRRARQWLARLFVQAWRPAWIVAAASLVLAIIFIPRALHREGERGPSMRGPDMRDPASPGQVMLVSEARVLAGGDLEFAWAPTEGVDRFDVRFFDKGMDEVARRDAGRATSLRLSAAERTEIRGAHLWQVVGLRGEEEAARTPLREIPGPGSPD
ncbi:MAG: hypothetical protein FJY88_07835 [Candidatus Eisenbacteria bacterium]|nr:hypothetical protein [Candidatus Eisenbacteria bacterium]